MPRDASGVWSVYKSGTSMFGLVDAADSKGAAFAKTFVATWIAGHTEADALVDVMDASNEKLVELKVDISVVGPNFIFKGFALASSSLTLRIISSNSTFSVGFGGYYTT